MAVGDVARPLVAAMKRELFANGYVQADETTVPVQSAAVRGLNHRGYLWQYSETTVASPDDRTGCRVFRIDGVGQADTLHSHDLCQPRRKSGGKPPV